MADSDHDALVAQFVAVVGAPSRQVLRSPGGRTHTRILTSLTGRAIPVVQRLGP
jgi:hypothetical protein